MRRHAEIVYFSTQLLPLLQVRDSCLGRMCRRQVQDIYSLPRSDFCGQLLMGTTRHYMNFVLESWNVKT